MSHVMIIITTILLKVIVKNILCYYDVAFQ